MEYKNLGTPYKTEFLTLYNCDCMDLLKQTPDNHYSLCICDPPYGIGESGKTNASRCKLAIAKDCKPFSGNDLTPASPEYFKELRRVSKNQIIWGANHFSGLFRSSSSCWVVWDKDNSGDFADCELAYTSFHTAVRIFKFRWNGMLQGDMKNKEQRIHPTQKPVKLYDWLLMNYAEEGQTILDTHMGSGSIAIARHYAKCPLVACELDRDYYDAACERIEAQTRQTTLF